MISGWVALLAGLFRLRGSETWAAWTGMGATSIRLLWAGASALAAWTVGEAVGAGLALALAAALWLGCILPWWDSLGVRTAAEVARHSARGLVWTGPAAAVLALSGAGLAWPLLAVGALCGPVYLACRRLDADYAVQGAEWVWGAMIAAALLLSVA
jgi:hypothetical protein